MSKHERGRFDKKGGRVDGISVGGQSIADVYFKTSRRKLATILNDYTHPLYSNFDSSRMEGSGRLPVPLARTNLIFICAISNFHV